MQFHPTAAHARHMTIDPGSPLDLWDWARHFGVSTEQLRQAIREVGQNVQNVDAYLYRELATRH